MTTSLKSLTSRFCRDESGSATIEFVLQFSILITILAASVDLSNINIRHAMLERSVEIAVRDIRLNTGDVPSFEAVRTAICEEAGILQECESNLMLEMKQVDPTNFAPLSGVPDCINAREEPRPVRQFNPGQDNDLMLLRVCFKYNPIFPATPLAAAMDIDDEGYAMMVVQSAFVQEPR
ncbi:pilus assembly protein [Marivita sp.]|uniref:TadE/TadG family type IV pilus assembly protein n=1 Tax=Marivita sp. TaxID=2003365 RepID=UPI0025BE43CB|nr:pilus assembly protein [Marivita sp.]